MKKMVITVAALLLLAIVAVYAFIPSTIKVSSTASVQVNDRWAFKYIADKNGWKQWLPASADTALHYNGMPITLDTLFYNSIAVKMGDKNNEVQTRLLVIPVQVKEAQLAWTCEVPTSNNPFTRWTQYRKAIQVKETISGLVTAYSNWLSKPENVYGFKVIASRIVDTLLLTKMVQFKGHSPDEKQIDSLLNILRKHAEANGAKQDGYPMMHVISNQKDEYDAQVALPINKVVPQTADLKIKYMFTGNVLTARFKGGFYIINKAYEAVENYRMDNQRVAVAIPFQSMITDRMKERDTSKWETVVNFPVQ